MADHVGFYDRAAANGVTFRYLTFDEGYGGKPEFLREVHRRGQAYVAEVPRTFTGWLTAPETTDRHTIATAGGAAGRRPACAREVPRRGASNTTGIGRRP